MTNYSLRVDGKGPERLGLCVPSGTNAAVHIRRIDVQAAGGGDIAARLTTFRARSTSPFHTPDRGKGHRLPQDNEPALRSNGSDEPMVIAGLIDPGTELTPTGKKMTIAGGQEGSAPHHRTAGWDMLKDPDAHSRDGFELGPDAGVGVVIECGPEVRWSCSLAWSEQRPGAQPVGSEGDTPENVDTLARAGNVDTFGSSTQGGHVLPPGTMPAIPPETGPLKEKIAALEAISPAVAEIAANTKADEARSHGAIEGPVTVSGSLPSEPPDDSANRVDSIPLAGGDESGADQKSSGKRRDRR